MFFGEGLPERFHKLAAQDLAKADLLLVIGTSLQAEQRCALALTVSR